VHSPLARPTGTPSVHPGRLFAGLFLGASLTLLGLVGLVEAGSGTAPAAHLRFQAVAGGDTLRPDTTRADTSRTDTTRADTSRTDTTGVLAAVTDTTAGDTLRRSFLLPSRSLLRPERPTASVLPRDRSPLATRLGAYWRHDVRLDSTGQFFVARELVGDNDVRMPVTIDYDEFRRERLMRDLRSNWSVLAAQRAQQRAQQRRGGLGVNIVIPGGRQSAFTTIFGKPEVDLRVTGQADIRAGFDYRQNDQQAAITGRGAQLDPDFKQDLRLGITGSIGDKLRVDVNWDTNNDFDFQNQLKLQYTGYEDDIIQRIEAGNVFLQTPSTLIRGGQSLFGIKSELQIGGVRLTTVASQQEGQSSNLSISGGSETVEFGVRPLDYDENSHFFLGYYFRNRWETALSQPPNILVAHGFDGITEIELWKIPRDISADDRNMRSGIAVVDLGENVQILSLANAYTSAQEADLPRPERDQYNHAFGGELDTRLRSGAVSKPGDFLEAEKGLTAADYQEGRFRRLQRGTDYDLNEWLGYVSLRQRLSDGEALAVAYRYNANGRTFQVGDFAGSTGGAEGGLNDDRLVLKLLRPANLRQPSPNLNPAAWWLQLRNIYRLQGSNINLADFDLNITYEAPGRSPTQTLPGVGRSMTLLQHLGLDRVNDDLSPQPNNRFDRIPGFTIEPRRGLLIFPYLEPFGSRLAQVIEAQGEGDKAQLRDQYVFDRLYLERRENAQRDPKQDLYRIRGSYSGSVQDFYDLRAFAGLVPGSVRVASGGTPLSEGTHFIVDYQGGTVTITDPSFLTPGRQISIDYEQNSFFNIQKKTLLGARADYQYSDRLNLGATMMQLSQKSPVDKFRLGEEPISNLIWGLDGSFRAEPRWLTRAIDRIPLVQTRAQSSIQFSGEFAQLRPGATQTIAFQRTRRDLQRQGFDFNNDELSGVSYLDDFEGFENTFSLRQPGAWRVPSAPDSIGRYPGSLTGTPFDSLRTNWRGSFGWYTINANVLRELAGKSSAFHPASVSLVNITDVYPNRDDRGELDRTITTLDVHFDPRMRGPYNFTRDLDGFIRNPRDVWGGMIMPMPEGYKDFSLKNIEFLEFIFRPFADNEINDAGRPAKLYVDLGSISEDVIPDGRLNTEDGLSTTPQTTPLLTPWGRLTTGTQNNALDINEDTRWTENLGLNGLASYDPDVYRQRPELTEQVHYAGFLATIAQNHPDPFYRAEAARTLRDPAADDYHHYGNDDFFGDPEFFPGGASLQQRFSRYYAGFELNSLEAQSRLANNTSMKRGISRFPSSEDLNRNSALDTENSYFQYEVPLSRAVIDSMGAPSRPDNFIVAEITDNAGNGTGWYQVRIPIRDYTRRVGTIQDFSLIESIRMWTTGHEVPVTLRFAALELVGSQWQTSRRVNQERDTDFDELTTETRVLVSSIDNERNPNIYKSPIGSVVSQNRLASGIVQNAREQAMSIRIENLQPGKHRAIYKTLQGTNLLRYSNLRMFVHMHGRLADGRELSDLPIDEARSKATMFVRLGANESSDYYEYEQPLTPSRDPAVGLSPNELWQTHQSFGGRIQDLNSMNIELSFLNQLKVARDREAFPLDSIYWNVDGNLLRGIDLGETAPPGTRIAIKGNPSLDRINTIAIGVRNASDSTMVGSEYILDDITVWVNELRVSGYDETNGWAAVGRADIRLADLGSIRANIQTQTDGFGSLSSTLAEREQNDIMNWGITSDLNLHKFIPERFGWSIPLSFQLQSDLATPRFAPSRRDVRLEDLLREIESQSDLSGDALRVEQRNAILAAQSAGLSRSFTARVQKSNSRSAWLQHTLDGISWNYSFADNERRSPTQRLNDQWRWTSTLNYRLNVRRPKTVEPLGFLGDLPVLGWFSGLQFNYLPNSITMSGAANRNFNQSQDRARILRADQLSGLPEEIEYPFREQHSFGFRRNFAMQYNPFNFLNLSFDTNANQSLNSAGADTTRNTFVGDRILYNVSPAEALSRGLITQEEFEAAQVQTLIQVIPTSEVFGNLVTGASTFRTDQYAHRFAATLRPRFQSRALNWFQFQDISYNATFNWQNSPAGRDLGASASNSADFRAGVVLRPQEFWRRFDFYQTLEKEQREAEQAARQARQRADQDRERRRREADQRKLEEVERRQREAEARANGIQLAEDMEPIEADSLMAEMPEPVATTTATQVQEKSRERSFPISLPSPRTVIRRTVLTLTGMQDLQLNYSGQRGANSSSIGQIRDDGPGIDTPYSLLDALRGQGPSIGYRLGLDRSVPLSQRVFTQGLQVTDGLTNTDRLQARTALNPSQSLRVNLTWNVDWSRNENSTLRLEDDGFGQGVPMISTIEQGSNRASVWAFGASYLDVFQKQLRTFQSDAARHPGDGSPIGDLDGDGRVVLTQSSIIEDFRKSYLQGLGPIDGRGLLPFPLPSWSVNFTGASNWGLVRRFAQSLTIQHGYNAEYQTDFRAAIADPNAKTFNLANRRIEYFEPDYTVNAIRINERYQPFIGMDVTWKNRMQTRMAWNRVATYEVSMSNFEIRDSRTNELTMTANYQKQGLALPFIRGGRLNNRVTFSMTVSRSETADQRYILRRALQAAITDPDFVLEDALSGDNVSITNASTRLNLQPQVSYQFSNRVAADFRFSYERFDNEDSRIPSYTRMNGGFNVRVSIAN
jgi:cell surface protein SprA